MVALLRLAFATAPVFIDINLAVQSNSPVHYAKGTQSGHLRTEVQKRTPPTACRYMISGSISLPIRGAFHLSLTVLVHYRSQESI